MDINLKDYDLISASSIRVENKEIVFKDITVLDNSTFFVVNEDTSEGILTHNCDGTHIKGLIMNMFEAFWPELLEQNFLYEFITPIVRAKKGKNEGKDFYSIDQYKAAKTAGELNGWKIKYYKGLGTIQPDEIKAMFKEVDKHLIPFTWTGEDSRQSIDKAFNKKRADDRKDWLLGYQGEIVPEKLGKPNAVTDFFDKEFIQYSMADNVRSIPNYMDGLKPSQRKILYACLKRNLREEVKVAQLSGAVAEISAYHSGEMSLNQTIVSMAQDFVGANNINLLVPEGQFGTRLAGGSDSASPRYIFTKLNNLTRLIYRPEDDAILKYLDDDGYMIEPEHYLPIIPMLLANGSHGVGTGWSTDVPMHDPMALIKVIRHKLEGGTKRYKLRPHYRGFVGEMLADETRYYSQGIAEKNKTGYLITELPIYTWTDKYCEFLDTLVDSKTIKGYKNNSSETVVNIQVLCDHNVDYVRILKLRTPIATTNMNAFVGTTITLFDTSETLMEKFFVDRLAWYQKRKIYMMEALKEQYKKLSNIAKFIIMVINSEIVVSNRQRREIEADMEAKKLDRIDESYDYLLSLPVYSLSSERKDKAIADMETKKKEYLALQDMTIEQLWTNDLNELEEAMSK